MFAIETVFGWTLQGRCESTDVLCNVSNVSQIENCVKISDNESIGLVPATEDDDQGDGAVSEFNADARCTVRSLSSSWFHESKVHLHQTVHKLLKQDKLAVNDATFKEHQTCEENGRYSPHQCVLRETSETIILRPVFDASAKGLDGVSLNDCLHEGPNMYPTVFGVLTRFRMCSWRPTGNIERAYSHLQLHEDAGNFVKFLWFKNSLAH